MNDSWRLLVQAHRRKLASPDATGVHADQVRQHDEPKRRPVTKNDSGGVDGGEVLDRRREVGLGAFADGADDIERRFELLFVL